MGFDIVGFHNFIMNKQKSWGGSTKSTSHYNSVTPVRQEHILFRELKESESKELSFHRLKNKELQETTLRLSQYVFELERDKDQLMKLNSKYVETLNQQFRVKHSFFEEQLKKCKTNSHPLCGHCNQNIFVEFQKDYRNLVKHCIILEQQITCKNGDLLAYKNMRQQLLSTKHENISDLVKQLLETTELVKTIKKQNNQLEYQIEKFKEEKERNKKASALTKNGVAQLQQEMENYKSLIYTIQNQSYDKEYSLKAKIYEMELVIEKLQKELREVQSTADKVKKKNDLMRVTQIEYMSQSMSQKRGDLTKSMVIKRNKKAISSSKVQNNYYIKR